MSAHSHAFRIGTACLVAGFLTTGAAWANCPDYALNGLPLSATSDDLWTPQSYPMTAGGGVQLSGCADISGHGSVTQAPSFTLTYDAQTHGRDLDFRIESNCDTVMVINDASARWHYEDDSDGTLNPRIRLSNASSGVYDIWLGTFGSQICPATLVLETFPGSGGGGASSGSCPDWSLGGAQVNLQASQLGARQEFAVMAGGGISLSGASCDLPSGLYGHVAAAPDFSVNLDTQGTSGNLIIGATGTCDTVLLINDNTANWHFNDDFVGLDPQITIENAGSGRYDVWIGTFGSSLCQATMYVEGVPAGGAAQSK